MVSSAFALDFSDGTTLSIDGAKVVATGAVAAAAHTFESNAVAKVAFEAVAQALERSGHRAEARCAPELPGILAGLAIDDDDDDDGNYVSMEAGRLVAANVCDVDPQTYGHLAFDVRRAPSWGLFDPASAPVEVLGVHALRRLLAHSATAQCMRFGIDAWGPCADALLDRLSAAGRGAWLTHLDLHGLWVDLRVGLCVAPRALGASFPNLRALGIPLWSWPLWDAAPMLRLDRLRLSAGPLTPPRSIEPPVVPPLGEILDRVARRAPALRQLALTGRAWDAQALETLASHALVERLTVLDLFSIHDAFDHDALLRARPRLAHLERIVVGTHSMPSGVPARYGAWPAVKLASYVRRELRAFDAAWDERSP